jgi:hypothetical protein
MKILIACEESQTVCKAFRERGHEAYSCDILPCSGGKPEWHIRGDVLPLLKEKWDMIIAFPPCTYLTYAGIKHWDRPGRAENRELAKDFFMLFVNADCKHKAIENPVGYMNTIYRKPDQIIQPYQFGENAQKRTCLWLYNLPKLIPTKILQKPEPMYICQGEKCKGKKINWCEGMRGIKGGQAERAKARNKTFPGIAQAMADQWSNVIQQPLCGSPEGSPKPLSAASHSGERWLKF